LSQSVPTPNTHELFRVVTSDAVGAPEAALPPPVAPIAPDPFVPVVSVPLKATTVIDDTTFCDKFAVTVALLSAVVANARHISAPPGCALVRFTRAQVNPPPVTLLTVRPPEEAESAETNANNNSFGAAVENAGLVTDVAAVALSVEVNVSMANCPGGGDVVTVNPTVVEWLRLPRTPEIVSVDVPAAVVPSVVMVNVDDPDPVIVVGLNVPVAPAGRPLTPRVTVPENPFTLETVAV
jgi:hypothetical protein